MANHTLSRTLNSTGKKSRKKKPPADYLSSTHAAVRTMMAAVESMPDFRMQAGDLTHGEKLLLVQQALILIQENYVHLPLKENMHAVRPVQALRRLQQRLQTVEADMPDLEFHRAMIEIFTSVRDLHTNYFLPSPFNQKTAFVPFLIEPYFQSGIRRFMVSHLVAGFTHPTFGPGVDITHWNGAPIDLAVAANAARFAGSNEDARRARGIERMTIRPLTQSLPPDEDFVLVGYRTPDDGQVHEIRLDWMVFTPDTGGANGAAFDTNASNAHAWGIDMDSHLAGLAKMALFAPKAIAAEAAVRGKRADRRRKNFAAGETIPSDMPSVIEAQRVETNLGEFGHIRIRTFSVQDAAAFVAEVVRLAELLPDNGLILDVRGNGGGLIWAGELLLQTITPNKIEPEPVQFINTPLNLDLVRRNSTGSGIDLTPWRDSMEESVGTGAVYSRGRPITDPDLANAFGQRYQGPVVLITDAKCYSTTDIFAAGFQDHNIGPIIGVDGNTGAGGANVWTQSLLRSLAGTGGPYRNLPNGAGMRVAIRRTLRVGARAGTPVEDLGVQPDMLYEMTRRDLLESNTDLLEFAAAQLAQMPTRSLRGEITDVDGDEITLSLETAGLDRVDVYLDQRPIGGIEVNNEQTSVTLTDAGAVQRIDLQGFENGEFVAAWRIVGN